MNDERDRFTRFEELYWEVTRGMGNLWARVFASELPGSQAYLVSLLEKEGRVRMSRLAESLQLTGGAVTSASDKLLERGFVTRTRDAEDRRVVYLELTDEGRHVLKGLREQGHAAMKQVFGHLQGEDLEKFVDVFDEARHALRAMIDEGENG